MMELLLAIFSAVCFASVAVTAEQKNQYFLAGLSVAGAIGSCILAFFGLILVLVSSGWQP